MFKFIEKIPDPDQNIDSKIASRILFYFVSILLILVSLLVIEYNPDAFRWWFIGYGANFLHHVMGVVLYIMPTITFVASFFIKKNSFFIVFTIINITLLPIAFLFSIMPAT